MNYVRGLLGISPRRSHYFEDVSSDEEAKEALNPDFEQPIQPLSDQKHTPGRTSRILLAALISTILAIALIFSIYRFNIRKPTYDQCGTTPAEARARGCIFEVTSSSWVVPACYDEEVEVEFLASYEWHFYRDINYTIEAPLSDVRLGEDPGFFVSSQYHINHCGFLLKKMHRALKRGEPVDGYIWPLHHTDHCIKWLTNPTGQYNYKWPQYAYRKYPYCGKEGGFSVDKKRVGEWV